MIRKIQAVLAARYQSLHWLSCLSSPRMDLVSRWRKWPWLADLKRSGCYIDPGIEIRCEDSFVERLKFGRQVAVDKGCILWLTGEEGLIELGENVYIGPCCYLGSHQRLRIGVGSIIGGFSYLITCNHRADRMNLPIREQGYVGGPIHIGSDVWLGCHVVVLPGVTIGDGAIIGAGAVVTHDVPAGQVWVGSPAKFLRNR